MPFSGFSNEDFDVFLIDGLEQRMEELIKQIRPKLEFLGSHFAASLSVLTGQEIFAHVAKHARRTKNPPKDTWVAFANNKRGYKMLPHFQIGLWESHLFIWFAVIYECPMKQEFGNKLELKLEDIYEMIPNDFYWSTDHTKPQAVQQQQLTKEDLLDMFSNLQTVKKAELLCGYQIPREKAVEMSPAELISKTEDIFKRLLPLYEFCRK